VCVTECDRATSTTRTPWPIRGCRDTKIKIDVLRLRVCIMLTGLPILNTLHAVRLNDLQYLVTQHDRFS